MRAEAPFFKSLAEETRLKILWLLAEMFAPHSEAQVLRARLHDRLGKKRKTKTGDEVAKASKSSPSPSV